MDLHAMGILQPGYSHSIFSFEGFIYDYEREIETLRVFEAQRYTSLSQTAILKLSRDPTGALRGRRDLQDMNT